MKIVIIGGTGFIGSRLVALLQQGDHEIVSASPSTGVNAFSGVGLAEAVSGADIVVDVSNSPSLNKNAALAFFEVSGRLLMSAEGAAQVKHHVVLSMVGTDRIPEDGYFRAKAAQENLVRASGTPYTILKSAPFFEFLNGIVEADADGSGLRVPAAYVQPVAADDVARALCEIVLERGDNEDIELVGPDRFHFADLAQAILVASEDPRPVFADPNATYFGATLQSNTLMPSGYPRFAPTRFEDWLRRSIADTLAVAS